ncbi:hypothetical protein F5X68DRAFT_251879 [Plectosphaerella plurivora]|uniref:NAD(P)-binding domain-containing protein n=1 Tax=Plectosphaerella plurivora TaxID=936078 RepID=A0A9P8V0A5_9PEZI|nr:hypothetical protein F5X68DRAFT_251879 [Plectosphaerella plurivora]
MTKIFLTGASGYIGGEVIHQLAEALPNHRIRALVRDATKTEAIATVSGQIEIVPGTLDDVETIAGESAAADVVLHLAATGHLASTRAIYDGLAKVATAKQPRHWIQISGASALAAAEIADTSRVPGSPSDTIHDDLSGAENIRDIIHSHPSRAVDNLVLGVEQKSPGIKTALVFGPVIYGEGSGPVNKRSIQVPSLAKATLKRRRGLQIGSGLSRWGNIHIGDLGRMIIQLVKAASASPSDGALWGHNGLYLAGVGEIAFGDISKQVAAAARTMGLCDDDEVEEVYGAEADALLPHGNVLFGTNARGRPLRAEHLLGWVATGEPLEKEIPRAAAAEAKALGLQ